MAKRESRSSAPRGYHDAFESFIKKDLSEQSKALAQAASQVLQISSSYQKKVARLNGEYLSAADLKDDEITRFDPDEDGKFRTGRFKGRRTLVFSHLNSKNRFVRVGSPQTRATAFPHSDFIFLAFPMDFAENDEAIFRADGEFSSEGQRGKIIAPIVASLAHETIHAFHRFTRSTLDPLLPRQARADAFIEEEIATREGEKTILKEILAPGKRKALETAEKKARSTGLRKQLENQIETMLLSRAEVERDFLSGTSLTYLETFVIEDMLKQSIKKLESEAIRKNKSLSEAIRENEALVRNLVFTAPLDKVLQTDDPELLTKDKDSGRKTESLPEFAVLLLMRRLIEEHWQTSGEDMESIVESHRKALSPDNTPNEFHFHPMGP